MTRNLLAALFLAVAASAASLPARAAEPALHDIYQAAAAGRLEQARGMIQEVLRSHPNSAKAHFVDAELLARQGQLQQAAGELARAESLAPGLPFAQPQAVENLRTLLRTARAAPPDTRPASAPEPAAAAPGLPWGFLVGGLGLIAFLFWALRRLPGRGGPAIGTAAAPPVPAYGGGPAYGGQGSGTGTPPAPAGGSGIGARLMGGLATGAAVGAGVVAGEALARHFLHDDGPALPPAAAGDRAIPQDNYLNDLGGTDFGVTDTASWDDGDHSDWN